jgi:hypothetical protein
METVATAIQGLAGSRPLKAKDATWSAVDQKMLLEFEKDLGQTTRRKGLHGFSLLGGIAATEAFKERPFLRNDPLCFQ